MLRIDKNVQRTKQPLNQPIHIEIYNFLNFSGTGIITEGLFSVQMIDMSIWINIWGWDKVIARSLPEVLLSYIDMLSSWQLRKS